MHEKQPCSTADTNYEILRDMFPLEELSLRLYFISVCPADMRHFLWDLLSEAAFSSETKSQSTWTDTKTNTYSLSCCFLPLGSIQMNNVAEIVLRTEFTTHTLLETGTLWTTPCTEGEVSTQLDSLKWKPLNSGQSNSTHFFLIPDERNIENYEFSLK